MLEKENVLLLNKHILICLNVENDTMSEDIDHLKSIFCGTFQTEIKNNDISSSDKIIYLCGNISQVYDVIRNVKYKIIYVIRELSNNYENCDNYEITSLGNVPINIHNVGVYFRNFFNSENKDYFNLIKNEHEFQMLTESNKPTFAFRKGIYLSKIEEVKNELKYHLLRCSSNLNGSTDNFRDTDKEIVNQVNNISQYFFEEKTELNHVLAQIYENNDQGKAKISAHSDKTKDMPRNGLIAFCSFYESYYNDKFNDIEKKIKQ